MSRAGFVALVGAPNAGKSTLFNRLIGESLAAITPKPQTTRFHIPGIVVRGEVQYIFVDTPGWIAKPKNRWHEILTHQSLSIARDADELVWVISLRQIEVELPSAAEKLLSTAPSLIVAFTHGDQLSPSDREARMRYFQQSFASMPVRSWLDASIDQPLEPLLDKVAELLPESPFLYPEGELTPLPVRFFVAEILREVLYTYLHEEIPYGTEVEITQYREGEKQDYIAATIHVEKASHKPIVIGQRGQMLKKIGMEVRQRIESLIGKPVYLELYVKVSPRWRQSLPRLRSLGYRTS